MDPSALDRSALSPFVDDLLVLLVTDADGEYKVRGVGREKTGRGDIPALM